MMPATSSTETLASATTGASTPDTETRVTSQSDNVMSHRTTMYLYVALLVFFTFIVIYVRSKFPEDHDMFAMFSAVFSSIGTALFLKTRT